MLDDTEINIDAGFGGVKKLQKREAVVEKEGDAEEK